MSVLKDLKNGFGKPKPKDKPKPKPKPKKGGKK